jgi:hypothetical protein
VIASDHNPGWERPRNKLNVFDVQGRAAAILMARKRDDRRGGQFAPES